MADSSLSTADDSDYGSNGIYRVDVEHDEHVNSSKSDACSIASTSSANRVNFYLDLSASRHEETNDNMTLEEVTASGAEVIVTPEVKHDGSAVAHQMMNGGTVAGGSMMSLSSMALLEQYQSLNRRSITSMHSPTSYVSFDLQPMPGEGCSACLGTSSPSVALDRRLTPVCSFDHNLFDNRKSSLPLPPSHLPDNRKSSLPVSPTDSVFCVECSAYSMAYANCSKSSVCWKSARTRNSRTTSDDVFGDEHGTTNMVNSIYPFVLFSTVSNGSWPPPESRTIGLYFTDRIGRNGEVFRHRDCR
jgi:hypothetical protein